MQRDLKIGLSLSVLLIGVVAALFFRRDDSELANLPVLKTGRELDLQIQQTQGNLIPYIAQSPARPQAQAAPSTLHSQVSAVLPAEGTPSPPQSSAPVAEIVDVISPGENPAHAVSAEKVAKPARAELFQPEANASIPQVRTQQFPKRWSSGRQATPIGTERNRNWEVTESKIRSSTAGAVPVPVEINSPSTDEHVSELTLPSPRRKLAPNPQENLPRQEIHTEQSTPKFSRPESPPFTSRPTNRVTSDNETFAGSGSNDQGNERTLNPEQRYYEVQPGDSLEGIARRTYGSRAKVQAIFEANRDQLSDPHQITVGMKLRLP